MGRWFLCTTAQVSNVPLIFVAVLVEREDGRPRMSDPKLTIVQRERDFYRSLLSIAGQPEPGIFLNEALDLAVEITGAKHGYLALYPPATHAKAQWWVARGFGEEEVALVENSVSTGIIAAALAEGRTVRTSSALCDPRFQNLQSVRRNQIEAVLCAPIGAHPPVGVVYLQGQDKPGMFSDASREAVENFTSHLVELARRVLREQPHGTDPTLAHRERLSLRGLIGRSEALARVFGQVSLVAPLDVHVLLSGPSGSGKTLLAHAIKDNGPRRNGPLVELNCAAIPENLIESELFGAVRGAHSTAHRDLPGKIAAAEGGTLFLDEIGELPLGAQAKLLQLLQSRTYYPLGSSKRLTADVRILAASNADLKEAVVQKRFREDLFYRLRLLPIEMPPLSQRQEDIALIAQHVASDASRRHKMRHLLLSDESLEALGTMDWPGNVRQLSHTVEAAVIRANGEGAVSIEPSHLFPGWKRAPVVAEPDNFHEATQRFQKGYLQNALDENGWNVSAVSRKISLARSRIYGLIRQHNLKRKGESDGLD